MNIYWFCDKDGHLWLVFAARNEKGAWELLAEDQRTCGEPGDVREEFELEAVTAVTDTEGRVATIFPLEVDFTIRSGFGDEGLGHRTNF